MFDGKNGFDIFIGKGGSELYGRVHARITLTLPLLLGTCTIVSLAANSKPTSQMHILFGIFVTKCNLSIANLYTNFYIGLYYLAKKKVCLATIA